MIGVHRLAFGLATVATILVCRYRLSDPADPDAGLAVVASTVLAGGLGFGLAAVVTPVGGAPVGRAAWIITCSSWWRSRRSPSSRSSPCRCSWSAPSSSGSAIQSTKICVDAEVQTDVDDDYRGRVFSFYDMIYNAAFVTAAVFAVLVLPPDGYSRPALVLMAALYAVAGVGYARLAPR